MKTLPLDVEREYLEVLDLDQEAPSLAFLEKICTKHLCTLPFENISKLIFYRDRDKNGFLIPPMYRFVANHRQFKMGGTCYTLNSNLHHFLVALGFNAQLVPLGDKHMGILVEPPELQGEKVYVDCGAAAPFFRPVRFETDVDNASTFGSDTVFIRKDAAKSDFYHYQRYSNGRLSGPEWTFHTHRVQSLDAFEGVVFAANLPGTTFMNILRCQLWQLSKGRSVSLVNNVFTIRYADGNEEKTTLHCVEDIARVIHDEFELPNLPISEAVQVLEELGVDIFAHSER